MLNRRMPKRLTLLTLLQSSIFLKTVNQAARHVQVYTRTYIAHERFDCNWRRGWTCMVKLLDALGCAREAASLQKCCEPKFHSDNGGETVPLMRFHLDCLQVRMLTSSAH